VGRSGSSRCFRIEADKGFDLVVSVFGRYDSQPASATTAKGDLVTTLAISWGFRSRPRLVYNREMGC
jgi:hypothetical protein